MVEISYPGDHRDIPEEIWSQMNLTPEQYYAMRAHRLEREHHAPAVGDPAPDFEVERLSAEGARTGERFRLSAALGKPIGLIFGSYT